MHLLQEDFKMILQKKIFMSLGLLTLLFIFCFLVYSNSGGPSFPQRKGTLRTRPRHGIGIVQDILRDEGTHAENIDFNVAHEAKNNFSNYIASKGLPEEPDQLLLKDGADDREEGSQVKQEGEIEISSDDDFFSSEDSSSVGVQGGFETRQQTGLGQQQILTVAKEEGPAIGQEEPVVVKVPNVVEGAASNGPFSINQTILEKSISGGKETKTSGPQCQEKRNIVFFKMHKCGSSTMQNILMRFGDERGLSFVLPPSGNYLGHDHFNSRYMLKLNVKEYNILCHHTRFSYKGMSAVMPSNSVFVTILRDPAPMFESHFTYNRYDNTFGLNRDHALEIFLMNPGKYYYASRGKSHSKDPMLYDLGLENAEKEQQSIVDRKIQDLDKQFDLVMITEFFKESLILLKELMCWGLDDVVHFVVNARNKDSIKKITADMEKKIRGWNIGDSKLYDHFNKTLWRKIEAFGYERMKKEVEALDERNKMYENKCIEGTGKNLKGVWHPPGINIDAFALKEEAKSDDMCIRMARPELPYTDMLRKAQIKKYGIKYRR